MSEAEKFNEQPFASERDTRFAEAASLQMRRQTARQKRQDEIHQESIYVWQTGYMQRLYETLERQRDEAADNAQDAAGVARFRALRDVCKVLAAERDKAQKRNP